MTPTGRLLSVNVGELGSVELDGRSVQTGIHKEPVAGRVAVHALGLAGDHTLGIRTIVVDDLDAVHAGFLRAGARIRERSAIYMEKYQSAPR